MTKAMTRLEGYIVAVLLLSAILYDTIGAVFNPYGIADGRIIEETVEDMPIIGVAVLLASDNPREVFVWVSGNVGGSCTELHESLQKQEGDRITIQLTTLTTIRNGVLCTQEARVYYETFYLGVLSPGDYKINVNDVEKRLRID